MSQSPATGGERRIIRRSRGAAPATAGTGGAVAPTTPATSAPAEPRTPQQRPTPVFVDPVAHDPLGGGGGGSDLPVPSVGDRRSFTVRRRGSVDGGGANDDGITATVASARARSTSAHSTPGTSAVSRRPLDSPGKALGAASASGGSQPNSVSTRLSAAAPSDSTSGRAKVVIDRAAFSSINFSSPLMVNNLSNRILFPVLMRHRAAVRRALTSGGTDGGGGGRGDARSGAAASKLTASDGSALFSSARMMPGARSRYEDADESAEAVDHHALAGELSETLEEAYEEVVRLLAEEEATLQRQEVRCKRIEIMEKRRLATIRLGLEATSARLQAYEDRVSNAQAATAGIEQHLLQSNARVQRGKSVSQLLRYFKMFTAMGRADLSGVLKALSKTRIVQRTAVTDKWQRGRVSPFNPRYFTTVVSTTGAPGGSGMVDLDDAIGGGGVNSVSKRGVATVDPSDGPVEGTERVGGGGPGAEGSTVRGRKSKAVFRRGARRGRSVGGQAPSEDGARSGAVSVAQSRAASRQPSLGGRSGYDGSDGGGDRGRDAENDQDVDDDDNDDSSDESVDEAGDHLMNVKLQRAEAAAVAAGLDRMFAVRSYTEAQVEWCQKLMLLASELGDLASNTENIDTYVAWLRQELVADLFHVIARFDEFYDRNSQSAVHMGYGRALLKTMELVSRLYTTLTPSNDALLTVFFARAVNDLGVALFSEYSPRMLPSQPPLPNPTPLLAMDHFRAHTDGELRRAFTFLVDQVKRDVTVVETIFGMTSTARQQLLSQVTEGVVKRFIEQQVKLAETFQNGILASEANLSPRTKRRCGVRIADAIAYHLTVEARLFTFFQNFITELKTSFDAREVEFLGKYTDTIFVHRGEYSAGRMELGLLERYYTLIEEKYTRALHPIPDECVDLREAHMQKTKEMLDRLTEVATRIKTYALPKDVGSYLLDVVQLALKKVGSYLDVELRKTFDSIRADRDNWRLRPRSEEELLKPPKPESQQCGMRMLLFAQSSLMSLSDNIAVICLPLLQRFPRLVQDIEEARNRAMESLDDRAERLLNMCAQAIIIRSLAILMHYQSKQDYLPKDNKNKESDTIAPPCTRACTLFCYYITRQFEEAKEFIRLSNGQVPQRQTASQIASGANLHTFLASGGSAGAAFAGAAGVGGVGGDVPSYFGSAGATTTSGISAVRARARTMNVQQLVYGDGGPSSFVRTVGVCLYQGISAHLKSFTVNDRGALVYKQDVSAYKESMVPLTSTPGLGGAVVETLFQMLKETSTLLIMPLDHIKEVKESGTLRLLSNEEKLRFIRIRQDVKQAFKVIAM